MKALMLPRILAALIGLLMASSGLGWLPDPAAAAASLGMPFLEGMGRSSQIGDMTAFFVGIAVLCFWGAWHCEGPRLQSAALFLILTALFRVLAWAAYEAPFATVFIVIELVCAGLLLYVARRFNAEGDDIIG